MTRTFTFPLTKGERRYGDIKWTERTDAFSGDAEAVTALADATNGAIAARHVGKYPPPGIVTITGQPTSIAELITILEFGAFDMPDVFAGMTAAADVAKMEADAASMENDGIGAVTCY